MPLEYSLSCRFLSPREADHLDEHVRPPLPLRRRHIEEPPVEIERLFGVEKLVEIRLLR